MTARPYIQKTIVDLQAIFDKHKDDPAELKKLASELSHRKVSKAVALAKKVSDVLKGNKPEESKKVADPQSEPEQQRPASPPEHSIFDCQNCHQKLRIKLRAETQEYSCSSCNARFRASFSSGVLSVVFTKAGGRTESSENDAPSTLKDAYNLFNADETSPWEHIELTRRRLFNSTTRIR